MPYSVVAFKDETKTIGFLIVPLKTNVMNVHQKQCKQRTPPKKALFVS